MPKVTFIGHAGLALDAAAFRLLADPWLAPTGAFLGAWHQYPRNDHLDAAALGEADWVAVSHEHLDHFDPWVIGRLPARARILIPRYPGPAFRERMAAAAGSRQVIEIPAWEKFPLDNAGSWITVIPELSPMCHDAAFLIVADGRAVLHCNDARLTAAQARRAKHLAGGTLDLMAVQASGASWHPICYDYPAAEMARVAAAKRISKLRSVQRLVRQTGPALAVPFAGPPCFLDEEVRRLDWVLDRDGGAFCDPDAAVDWFREHLPQQRWDAFRPGDAIDLGTGRVTRDPVSAAFSFADEDRAAYLDKYAADRADAIAGELAAHPEPGPGLYERFARHFELLGGLSDYFLTRIDMLVRFEITGPHGGTWDVDLRAGGVTVAPAAPDARPHYRITTAGRWVQGVLDGRLAWEDLLISFRLTLFRDPDVYNDYLVGLLKHANAPALKAVEAYETGRDETERIVVDWGGRSYDIPRYCPHAGEDLSIGAVVRDGQVHCLAHNFAFDLATGACVNARSAALASREVLAAPPDMDVQFTEEGLSEAG
ncbi:Rieske 2Fe-2S domain-containing protein [Actinomadura parmotrematis]|uniref:Rieske 2Fe-2S domain-containing protein n=1 Tax=Actinomadura parmotrematis TaxID=2864039 RepID=A0ABS7FUX6_9ACTN|nr:Rieske 2Fe-2S domain-containing protein [Actinomadura parmotrematis]MBW8484000.1 Rieske 2Fe-2S domain-containing protein [Actinomadura parmotrematis]